MWHHQTNRRLRHLSVPDASGASRSGWSDGFGWGYLIRDVEAVIFQPLPILLPLPHLSLPLPPTKNEKTTVDNFFNFCGSVACHLLHFIILRGQKPSFIAITLPTLLKLIVPNYSVLLLFRY